MKLPLKGSKEYRALVTFTGFLIGVVWIAKDEYENPKLTGVLKAAPMPISDLASWNRQFGPTDVSKWAIGPAENEAVLSKLAHADTEEETIPSSKKATW